MDSASVGKSVDMRQMANAIRFLSVDALVRGLC